MHLLIQKKVDHNGYKSFPVENFFNEVMASINKQSIASFNVFLFELEEKNVTQAGGLYGNIYQRILEAYASANEKIKAVCDGLCNAIMKNDLIKSCYSIYLHCKEIVYRVNNLCFYVIIGLYDNKTIINKNTVKNIWYGVLPRCFK